MLSATGPVGGPLPNYGMAAPPANRQASPAADEASFTDAFEALVADVGDEPAANGPTAQGSTIPGPPGETPLDEMRASEGDEDAATEDLVAAFSVPLTELQRDALADTVPVPLTQPGLPDAPAPEKAAATGGGDAAATAHTARKPEFPPAAATTPDIPDDAGTPVSASAPEGQPNAREVFSPAESPVPVDLPDAGRVSDASRPAPDPATAAREAQLASPVVPAQAPAAAPARAGAPAADTPSADAKPAGTRAAADLVASVQTDAETSEVTSGAALADGQGSDGGSSGAPGQHAEAEYAAPAGPPRRFGRVEDMVRELDRQAAESPASSRPVVADARTAGPRPVATAVPAAAVTVPAPAPADVPRENVAALVQGIRVQIRQGVSEATVRLQPEHFGEVTIAVRLERGTVSAQVHADSAGVCEWLTGQEESIRSNLSEHGLQLDRYVVHRDRPRERRETPQQPNRGRAPRQDADAEQPRFEVAA